MAQLHVFTGVERRRRWNEEQKREIVRAAFAPGAKVADVARRADINSGLIYRWRQSLMAASSVGFAEVVVTPTASGPRDMLGPVIDVPVIDVVVSAEARVRIPASISPELAAAVISALAQR